MARLINGTYVEASNQLGVDLTGTEGSMQAWHKPVVATGEVMCKAIGLTGGTQRFAYGLDFSGGTFRFWIGNGLTTATGASGGGTPAVGRWYHMLGVRRPGGNQELWIDGKIVASVAPGTFTTTVDAFRLGQAVDGDEPCNGVTRDVAIWQAALVPDEIVRLYQQLVRPGDIRPQRLRGWWPVVGGLGPEPDLSRYAAHGTLSGTIPDPRQDESYEPNLQAVRDKQVPAPFWIGAQAVFSVQRP